MNLREKYKDFFHVGTIATPEIIKTHGELIRNNFSSLTAELDMKPYPLQPSENVFDFSRADMIYQFAKANDMVLRGHTLIWHNSIADWFFSDNGETVSKEKLEQRMYVHIERVLEHFHGKVDTWDVVNESISDNDDTLMRKSKWSEIMGDDFVHKAFKYAQKADPNVKRFYNDYNETNPSKLSRICDMIKDINSGEKLIDGMGMQCHWSIFHPNYDEIITAIEQYISLDLEIQVTELDVSMFAFQDREKISVPTDEMYERQAEFYRNIFAIFRKYKKYITSVTLWGAADDVSWKSNFPVIDRKDWPLLFDDNQKAKKCLDAIMDF